MIRSSSSTNWPAKLAAIAGRLRESLGPLALRIEHIGSTSIAGLAAKPVVDVQVSVRDFEPMADLVAGMDKAGFIWKSENPEASKRYYREVSGAGRTHVHVRRPDGRPDASMHQTRRTR